MRTSTVLGISISLATGIIVGWTVSNVTPEQKYPPIKDSQYNTAIAYVQPTPTVVAAVPAEKTAQPKPPQLERAQTLLTDGHANEALTILSDVSPSIDLSTENGQEWLHLIIDAYSATDNKEQLLLIYSRFPKAFSTNEQAALTVADFLTAQQNTADYNTLRSTWTGRESELARWTFLDAQEKVIEGKPAQAIKILENIKFKGKNETDRLVRLAALYVADDPKKAWNYLSQATKQDPENPDIRTFRASLGEMLNHSQTAHTDYIAAVQTDPENPFRREQLADFFLRTKQYTQALRILQDTMLEPSLDTIWLKTLFWSRVAYPVKKTWKGADIPDGPAIDFVAYLNAIPEDIFWNELAFKDVPDNQRFLDTFQETFWLQLITDLKKGDEAQAQQRLLHNSFASVSWSPELEKALKTTLNFRQAMQASSGTLSLFPRASDIENPQELTTLLASLSETAPEQLSSSIPLDLHDFLLSKEAFIIPFLAAGWTEAAIQLHAIKEFPTTFPGWIAASFTEALEQNRDLNTALEFAASQKSSSALSLLVAELALANDDKQTAFNALKGIYTSNDAHGRKAALMLGQFLMEHNNPQDAKKAILAQPALTDDAAAKELLARISVQEGDIDKAASLYLDIEQQSSEAKSFLARKAYGEKDWPRARKLTEALLVEFPENTTLSDNLKKILIEEKKQSLSKQTVSAK